MNKEEAKTLKYGDRIRIKYPHSSTVFKGVVIWVGRKYIHYDPCHLAPFNQKVEFEYAEKIVD